jgi:hypothetical protein
MKHRSLITISFICCILLTSRGVAQPAWPSAVSVGIRAFSTSDSTPVIGYAAALYNSSGERIDSVVAVSSNQVVFLNVPVTGVQLPEEIPQQFHLDQNYPNPFNPTTRIRFSAPRPGKVSMKTNTILGQPDASLELVLEAGTYEVEYEPGGAAGIVFYSLTIDGHSETRKMIQFGGPKSGRSRMRLVSSTPFRQPAMMDVRENSLVDNLTIRLYSVPVTTPSIADTALFIMGVRNDTMVTVWVREATDQIPAPFVRIEYASKASPGPLDTLYILDNVTPSWSGIRFTYVGYDLNSELLTYSWRADSNEWKPFSLARTALITAADLDTPYTGTHIFQVRAKNESGIVSPVDSEAVGVFNTIYPEFAMPGTQKKVLLINVNRNPAVPALSKSNRPDTEIMQFYQDIFTSLGIPYDVFNPRGIGHPGPLQLAHYTTVYIVTDNLPPNDIWMMIPATRYAGYLAAGGTMLMNTIAWTSYPSVIISPESLLVPRFGLHDLIPRENGGTYEINREFDCAGTFGEPSRGYPRLEIDTAKSDTVTDLIPSSVVVRNGCIRRVFTCQPGDFGEVIYRFDSNVDSTGFEYEPMGIRYIGPTYRTVWFGIPLFYVKRDQATQAIRKGMQDLGYPF